MGPYKATMTNAAYHAHKAVGSSQLKRVLQSPRHYLWHLENPTPPTPAMQFGTHVHTAILEPERFQAEVGVCPEFSGTGSRKAKADYLEANEGKTFISQDDFDAIQGILQSLDTHHVAKALLHGGEAESSFFSLDFDTGLEVKARPDYLRDHTIVDIKTCVSADPESFARAVVTNRYALSAAQYCQIVEDVTGQPFRFVLLAIEKTPPFGVAVYELGPETMNVGLRQYRRALQMLAECKVSGRYPGYPDAVQSLTMPPWFYKEDM